MTYFLLSILGFLSVHRIMYRLEKYFFMNRKKSTLSFVILTSPMYFFVFIKELFPLLTVYIGLILISLIFFSFIYEIKLKKVFLASHLNVIDGLILQLRVGNSTQKAISETFSHLVHAENIIYEPLKTVLKPDFDIQTNSYRWIRFYFSELNHILKSETRVIEQLEMFKRGLKVQNRFLARTSQVTRQIKAQALVACLVYSLIFTLSYYQLNLISCLTTVIFSLTLFLIGLFIIFKIGSRIKWKI
jgi:hypothetical protein